MSFVLAMNAMVHGSRIPRLVSLRLFILSMYITWCVDSPDTAGHGHLAARVERPNRRHMQWATASEHVDSGDAFLLCHLMYRPPFKASPRCSPVPTRWPRQIL